MYAVMAGLSPPIVRAGLMFAICSTAHLFRRAPDWLSGLYVSAIVILGVHPYALFDIGFQLSYMCVLSLFYLRGLYSPAIDRVRLMLAPKGRGVPRSWRAALAMLRLGARRAPQGALRMAGRQAAQKLAVGILEVVLASAAVQVGTLPAIVYYFGQTQWLGVAANAAIVPLSSAVLILSAVGAATTPLIPSIGGLAYAAAGWAATRTMAAAEFFAGIPGAGYSVGTVSPPFVVVYYGLLIWAARKLGAGNNGPGRGRSKYEEAALVSGSA
jgi:competence protein ComEC